MGFFSITTSGFLAAYALFLGCDNFQIGILAALPFLTQPLQILAIPLVERLRWRKIITLSAWIPAQLIWIPIALIPLFLNVPSQGAVIFLLAAIAIRGVFASVMSCAWNSWQRDLVPQQVLGSFYARRQMWANLAAMIFGLLAAFFVSYWEVRAPGSEALGYTFPLLLGAVFLGLASPVFISLIPEPLMPPPGHQPSLFSILSTPFRDGNYRHLLRFLFLWGLALNLSIPFFAVYMLQRLGLSLPAVIGFSILAQASNILFLRVWGPLADRFGIKAILSVSASLYLLVILGWTFTTVPERHFLTIPLLVVLHILAGVAAAGVTLATATIGLKLAPKGQATAYLAAAGLATSLGVGLGPLIGGYLGDFFSMRQLDLIFTWTSPLRSLQIPAFSLVGFDFVFCITFILGLFTLGALVALREEGEVGREVVLDALLAPMRQATRPMSSVPGLSFLSHFPYGLLRRAPLPGLDVALGVTAYQIAGVAKAATHGHRRVATAAKALEEALSGVWRTRENMRMHGAEVARHAARGTIHAKGDTALDEGHLARSAVLGIVRALEWEKIDSRDALHSTGYGVVQGAEEIGADPGEAAAKAVEAAREVAQQIGLGEEDASAYVAQGALDAATAIGVDAVNRVKASLPQEMLPADFAEQQEK
jgi:MFS family permease